VRDKEELKMDVIQELKLSLREDEGEDAALARVL